MLQKPPHGDAGALTEEPGPDVGPVILFHIDSTAIHTIDEGMQAKLFKILAETLKHAVMPDVIKRRLHIYKVSAASHNVDVGSVA